MSVPPSDDMQSQLLQLQNRVVELEKVVITAKNQSSIALAGTIVLGIILVLALALIRASI